MICIDMVRWNVFIKVVVFIIFIVQTWYLSYGWVGCKPRNTVDPVEIGYYPHPVVGPLYDLQSCQQFWLS